MNGRGRIFAILGAMALLVAAACGGAQPVASTAPSAAVQPAASAAAATQQAPVTVRVGLLSPNLVSVIHYIAQKTGAYQKNNVNVVEKKFSSGESAAGIEALIKGDLDVYIGAGAEVPRANSAALAKGQNPPLIVLDGATAGVTTLVLRNDLQAKSIDELKGKPLKIGVSSPSSIHLALFRGFLLDETKYTTESLGWQYVKVSGGDMVTALKTKQIDGFMHSEPTTSLAVKNDVGYVFMNARRGDMGKKAKILPVTFLSANAAWVKKDPEAARRYIKAMQDAGRTYDTMPKADMVAIMAEWAHQDPAIVSLAYDRLDPRMSMTADAAHAWWDVIASGMSKRGEITDKVTYGNTFDLSFAGAAK